MKKALIILAGIAVFALIVFNSRPSGKSDAKPMQIATVEKGTITDAILASGNLVFNTQVQLRSEVTGRVAKVLVEEGQLVEQGQLLMRLDTEAFAAEVNRAQAIVRASAIDIQHSQTRLANLERQLQRQQGLFDAKLAGEEAYENMKNARDLAAIDIKAKKEAHNQAKASLSIAQNRLDKSVFKAPMSGLLASVNIKEGETVIAGTTNIVGSDLMLVADPSAILAELRVDETDIANIKLNQATQIFAAAYPNKPFTGKVIHIGSAAKAQAGSQGLSFKVKVLLASDERPLYAGMSCRAEIATQVGKDTLKLPIEAIQTEDDHYYVWLVDGNNQVSKQTVEVGVSSDIEQAVLSGLKDGERVVKGPARALSKLKEGDEITVAPKQEKDHV